MNGLSQALSDSLGAIGQAAGSLPAVGGLMASFVGGPRLNVNGVLGSLNGVIQSPLQSIPQPTLRTQPLPLNSEALAHGLQLPKCVSQYVPSLSLLQQKKKFT